MKLSCEIIRDLLPLYAEELASTDSKAAVREHLEDCESCRTELEALKQPAQVPAEELGMRKVKKGIARRWLLGAACIMLAIVLAASCVGCWLFNPIYLPETVIESVEYNGFLSENSDEAWYRVWASATKAGYRWMNSDGRGWKEGNYYEVFYTTRYRELEQETPIESYVSGGTCPGAVWLFVEDGPMKLLYGIPEDTEPPARWSILEQSALWAAGIGGVMLTLGLILRKKRLGRWAVSLGTLGLCYAVCQWVVCGGSMQSFFPKRELLWAVLIAGSAWGIGMCVCKMRSKS